MSHPPAGGATSEADRLTFANSSPVLPTNRSRRSIASSSSARRRLENADPPSSTLPIRDSSRAGWLPRPGGTLGSSRTTPRRSARTDVGRVRSRSGKIDPIVQTITGIAEQTDLLAPNATIEAAPRSDTEVASHDETLPLPRPQLSRGSGRTAASARRCTSRAARGRRHPPRYRFSTASARTPARSDRPASADRVIGLRGTHSSGLDRRGLSFRVNAIARIAQAKTRSRPRRDYSFHVRGRPGGTSGMATFRVLPRATSTLPRRPLSDRRGRAAGGCDAAQIVRSRQSRGCRRCCSCACYSGVRG
jgi:hypothetical protein